MRAVPRKSHEWDRSRAWLGRPRATRDIEGLLDAHPAADVGRVSEWLRELADAAAMPELIEGFAKLLAQRARSR